MDLYPYYDVGQERSRYPRQNPKVEQAVGNREEQNVYDKDETPEAECHCDVLGIGGRRMMQSVTHRSRLVQARPMHRPAMICIFDPVRPYQPSEETHQESHLTNTASSQPAR